MNYQKAYNQLIEHAKQNPPTEYKEQHHIVPKAEGGSDDKTNLVKLTARQHYIAHLLLAKIYDDFKMYSALTYMQTRRHRSRKFKFNSRLYEKMRVECAKKLSAWRKAHPLAGQKNGMYGRKHTEESKKKMSNSHRGAIPWNKGKTGVYSDEVKDKIGASKRGKPLSEQHKQKLSQTTRAANLRADISGRFTGLKYWNNGIVNKRARECPEGFVRGRLRCK